MRRALILVAGLFAATPALADSCWTHNGSLMRLEARGDQRKFVYERPRPGLAAVGVTRGVVLFSGERRGERYSGIARLFSGDCRRTPLEYSVEGTVSGDERAIQLEGTREVHRNCVPTGDMRVDHLDFVYSHQC